MAKNKTKPGKKQQPRPRQRGTRRLRSTDDVDGPGLAHAAMLADPCGSNLVPTVYPGDRGYVNRFIANSNVAVSAGDTATVLVWKPGNQVVHFSAGPLSNTATTIAFGSANYPGASFYTTNAAKIRAAAFCVNVRPSAAPNTCTGTIYFGIVNAAAVPNGLSTSADALIPLLNESVSCSQALMAPLEVKWSPGSFDDRYNSRGVISDDDSDRNLLVIVAVGLPAASGLQIRTTSISEWSPVANLGVTNDATSVKPSKCDKDCILRHLKAKDQKWWWSLGSKALKFGKAVGSGYYTGGVVGAMGAAVRFM